ncbi:spermidine/putrescine ABC transporter substrate-binding protein, partial [Candidatus Saccharibacteria bacterium]|nr:spermidine/putrescine ABC transporter substrate-binding protein [Candidatus Saccharibacteria bacterium]
MKLLKKLKTPLLCLGIIALIVALVFLFNRPREDSSNANSTLNVLNWTSYIPIEVIKDFEEETGIKVNYGTYSSNEELLAKLTSSAPGTYDVVFPSDYMVDLLISKEMLAPLDHTKIENEKNLNPLFLHQPYDSTNAYSLPFLLATTVFLYDSTKVDRLTSYKDLANPALKNNLVMLDDQRIMIGAMLQATGHDMNDARADSLNDSLEFFEKIKPNIKAFDSDSPKTFFITKEVDAGLVWNAEATLAVEENPDLRITYPAEGFALSMDNYVILKNSKNVDAAHKFINYLLGNDVSKTIVEEYPYISPNRSVASLPDEELKQILSNGSYVQNVGADI